MMPRGHLRRRDLNQSLTLEKQIFFVAPVKKFCCETLPDSPLWPQHRPMTAARSSAAGANPIYPYSPGATHV
jgi:hypothetical protein